MRIDRRFFRCFLLVISALFLLPSYFLQWAPGVFASAAILVTHNFVFAFEDRSRRGAFLCFNGTFFIFLMGRLATNALTEGTLDFGFRPAIELHTDLLLYVSLLMLFAGYAGAEIIANSRKSTKKRSRYMAPLTPNDSQHPFIRIVQLVSFVILAAAFAPYLAAILEKVQYAQTHSYQALYLRETSSLPFWVKKLAEMFIPALYVFLAAMPKKKYCIVPMAMYLAGSFVSIYSGRRTEFALVVMLMVFYVLSRDRFGGTAERWLGRKERLLLLIGLPAVFSILFYFGYTRYGIHAEPFSPLEAIRGFFYEQGVSYRTIAYAKQYEAMLPDRPYFWGPVIEYFKENALTKTLLPDFQQYGAQTVAQALHGVQFGDALSFLVNRSSYLAGGGTGSSYLAETFYCYGIAGIVLVNLIYGGLLQFFDHMFGRNLWVSALCFFALYRICYAPRSSTLSFVTQSLNLINLLTMAVIFLLSFLTYQYYLDHHAERLRRGKGGAG